MYFFYNNLYLSCVRYSHKTDTMNVNSPCFFFFEQAMNWIDPPSYLQTLSSLPLTLPPTGRRTLSEKAISGSNQDTISQTNRNG